MNNDLSAEFRAASPIFGEKSSPSWIPVSYQDWQGNEVARVYSDEFGSYNALLPSTFTINPPIRNGRVTEHDHRGAEPSFVAGRHARPVL